MYKLFYQSRIFWICMAAALFNLILCRWFTAFLFVFMAVTRFIPMEHKILVFRDPKRNYLEPAEEEVKQITVKKFK